MGRSVRPAAELAKTLKTVGADNPGTGPQIEAFAKDGKLYQSLFSKGSDGREIFRETREIKWIIGSGTNGFAPVTAEGGYLFQAPLSFYSKINRWAPSPGYEFGNYGFNRPILAGCIACHSGLPSPSAEGHGKFEAPPFLEPAVACETCHGPGLRHVRAARSGLLGKASLIVNPARLSPELADNICMFCHQTGDVRVLQPGKTYGDFRPGEPLDETLAIFMLPPKRDASPLSDHVEHYYSMTLSRCYIESGRKLACISCHDPHEQPSVEQAPAYFGQKCANCHTGRSCKLDLRERLRQLPPNNCTGCHMPKRDVGLILHSTATNHRIVARPEEPFPEAAYHQTTPELPDLIHLNSVSQNAEGPGLLTLLQAYGELVDKDPHYRGRYLEVLSALEQTSPNNALVQASIGRKALLDGKFAEAAQHLRKALEIDTPQSETYADLAEAQLKLGQADESKASLERAVELDPYNPVFQKKLILRYIELKNYVQAQTALERYIKTFPQDTFMREMHDRARKSAGVPPAR